jgi:hypothetical protein
MNRISDFLHFNAAQRPPFRCVVSRRQLTKISIGVGLITQALGFSSFAILLLFHGPGLNPDDPVDLNTASWTAGILASLLIGVIFTAIACWYCSRRSSIESCVRDAQKNLETRFLVRGLINRYCSTTVN